MSPNARRMLHEALDLVLDALAEETREEPKARRTRAEKVRTLPASMTPEKIAAVRARLQKAGLPA